MAGNDPTSWQAVASEREVRYEGQIVLVGAMVGWFHSEGELFLPLKACKPTTGTCKPVILGSSSTIPGTASSALIDADPERGTRSLITEFGRGARFGIFDVTEGFGTDAIS